MRETSQDYNWEKHIGMKIILFLNVWHSQWNRFLFLKSQHWLFTPKLIGWVFWLHSVPNVVCNNVTFNCPWVTCKFFLSWRTTVCTNRKWSLTVYLLPTMSYFLLRPEINQRPLQTFNNSEGTQHAELWRRSLFDACMNVNLLCSVNNKHLLRIAHAPFILPCLAWMFLGLVPIFGRKKFQLPINQFSMSIPTPDGGHGT